MSPWCFLSICPALFLDVGSVCLHWNTYVNVWRSCMCAAVRFSTSAPGSVSGSLLVCRVDSPWAHRYRLYLTPNDPPERVTRERAERMERAQERENRGSERQRWTGRKNKRTWEEKMKEAWDWLSRQNQHQALDLSTYWWNPFRLFLTGKRP